MMVEFVYLWPSGSSYDDALARTQSTIERMVLSVRTLGAQALGSSRAQLPQISGAIMYYIGGLTGYTASPFPPSPPPPFSPTIVGNTGNTISSSDYGGGGGAGGGNSSKGGDVPIGAIVGGAIAAIVVALLVWWFYFRDRGSNTSQKGFSGDSAGFDNGIVAGKGGFGMAPLFVNPAYANPKFENPVYQGPKFVNPKYGNPS